MNTVKKPRILKYIDSWRLQQNLFQLIKLIWLTFIANVIILIIIINLLDTYRKLWKWYAFKWWLHKSVDDMIVFISTGDSRIKYFIWVNYLIHKQSTCDFIIKLKLPKTIIDMHKESNKNNEVSS